MSIANKLIYLNTTKDKLKDSINNIGGSITDETTFRAYATELDNIYSNIPKTTGEGSNLSLTTIKGRINVDDIKGDTTQDGTPTPSTPIDIEVVTGQQEVVVSNSSAYNKDFINLPNTYQAVKYIQSDGNQYFYLNSQWGNTSKIEAIIGTDDEYNNNVFFSASDSAGVWLGFSNSTTMSGGGFTNLAITPQTTATSYKTLGTITFSYSLTSTGNIRWGTYGISTYNKTNRIASLKLYDTNNTLIRNMVACYRISDNVIGMYDLIGNVFYTNEGTGTFTKGDDLQSQTKTLHLGDIELAKIGTYQDRIFETSGKNIDSSIVESGSLSNGENIAHGECYRSKDYIEVSPNTTYIFSVNNTANRVVISMYNSNKEFIDTDGTNGYVAENGIFTTYSNCYYIRFRSYGADGQLFNTGNIMINLGSTALPYEPYGSDKWYIEKNIGKVVLNGSETGWNSSSIAVTGYISVYKALVSDRQGTNDWGVITSHFVQKPYSNWTGGTADTFCETAGNNIGFRLSTSIASSLNNWKTWLASNNVAIYYVLSTPTYTEITNETLKTELNELEKMMSYNGTTNISISGNLPMILNVSALKGE